MVNENKTLFMLIKIFYLHLCVFKKIHCVKLFISLQSSHFISWVIWSFTVIVQ